MRRLKLSDNKSEVIQHGLHASFSQEPDGNSSDDQFLELSIEDCGGGEYYVISTERWAFDCLEDFKKLLEALPKLEDEKE